MIEYAPVECMYMRETGTVEQVSAYVRVRGEEEGEGVERGAEYIRTVCTCFSRYTQ